MRNCWPSYNGAAAKEVRDGSKDIRQFSCRQRCGDGRGGKYPRTAPVGALIMIVNVNDAAARMGIPVGTLKKKVGSGAIPTHRFQSGKRATYLYWYEPEVMALEKGEPLDEREMKRNETRWLVMTLDDIVLRTTLPRKMVKLILQQCETPTHTLRIKKYELTVYLEKEVNFEAFDAEVPGTGPRKRNYPYGSRAEDQHIRRARDGRYYFDYKLTSGRKCRMHFPNMKTERDPLRESSYLAKARYEVRRRIGVGKPAWKTTNKMRFPDRKRREEVRHG